MILEQGDGLSYNPLVLKGGSDLVDRRRRKQTGFTKMIFPVFPIRSQAGNRLRELFKKMPTPGTKGRLEPEGIRGKASITKTDT